MRKQHPQPPQRYGGKYLEIIFLVEILISRHVKTLLRIKWQTCKNYIKTSKRIKQTFHKENNDKKRLHSWTIRHRESHNVLSLHTLWAGCIRGKISVGKDMEALERALVGVWNCNITLEIILAVSPNVNQKITIESSSSTPEQTLRNGNIWPTQKLGIQEPRIWQQGYSSSPKWETNSKVAPLISGQIKHDRERNTAKDGAAGLIWVLAENGEHCHASMQKGQVAQECDLWETWF